MSSHKWTDRLPVMTQDNIDMTSTPCRELPGYKAGILLGDTPMLRTTRLFLIAAFLTAPLIAGEIEVYFSPDGGLQDAIVREINAAQKSIKVQCYSFTNKEIAKALLEAKKRGVKIEVILDKSQRTAKYSSATFFHNQGIPLLIDAQHAIMHNKVMLIDGGTIITGSANFSRSAEVRNAENILILKGFPDVFEKYLANHQEHREHAEEYKGSAP